jgi:hypothetical protein
LSAGHIGVVVEHAGIDAVRRTLLDGAAPYRRADASCLFRDTFRHVLGRLVPTVRDVRFRPWARRPRRV